MQTRLHKYWVKVYTKSLTNECWQTLGPYDYDIAEELVHNYLKKGICSWVEDVEISE